MNEVKSVFSDLILTVNVYRYLKMIEIKWDLRSRTPDVNNQTQADTFPRAHLSILPPVLVFQFSGAALKL